MITLFTQPMCGPCIWAKRTLEKLGVQHQIIDIRQDETAAQRLMQLGATGTPYLINEQTGRHWKFDVTDPEAHLNEKELSHA